MAEVFSLGRMKFSSIICLLALAGCSRSPVDPIDALMSELPYQMVPSYMFVPIPLPPSASPDSVVHELESTGIFSHKGIGRYTTLQTRSVHTTPRDRDLREGMHVEYYTAVLLDTDAGRKIVLLRPLKGRSGHDEGWYYRIYSTK